MLSLTQYILWTEITSSVTPLSSRHWLRSVQVYSLSFRSDSNTSAITSPRPQLNYPRAQAHTPDFDFSFLLFRPADSDSPNLNSKTQLGSRRVSFRRVAESDVHHIRWFDVNKLTLTLASPANLPEVGFAFTSSRTHSN
jgi:hypothetical protein